MSTFFNTVRCTVAALALFVSPVFAQHGKSQIITDKAELLKLKNAVEKGLDSLGYHQKYISAMGLDNPELEKQYAVWMAKFPMRAKIPYALAKGYLNAEDPRAKPYLLKAVEIDPKFADAWGGLWTDCERWGDFKLSATYLQKAAETDPSNPNYAFYYASSFKDNSQKWRDLSLDVAKRFPDHERGAQALYWLAARSKSTPDKIKYFELLRVSYDPLKFSWSAAGMPVYFDVLLASSPQKALDLAQDMAKDESGEGKQWPAMVNTAKIISEAKKLIGQNKGAEAAIVLKNLQLPRGSGFSTDLLLLKADVDDIAGNTGAAYDSLLSVFAVAPKVVLKEAIYRYGSKLGKTALITNSEILNKMESNAKSATPFNNLKRYLSPGAASLSDFKGKVVLLTYWFPGCGPCRAEFPHFENVLKKFNRDEVEYIGINIVSKQNDYVVPFMKSSGYSFTPLEEVDNRQKGNLDNRNAAPVNFLIDKDGKLYFSRFRTGADNEEDLELMISLLLNKEA